jgi:CheY-like chemotaxis protein
MIAKPLVLIIEDNEDFQNLYGLVANQSGYEVEKIVDGQEALERLERGPLPTVVLLNTFLPNVGGDEILVAIRANKKWDDVPVFRLTADIRASQEIGISPDATKPDGIIEKGGESLRQLRELFARYGREMKN